MKKGKRVSESIARQMAIRCLMAVEKGSFAEQTLIDLLDHINISTLDRSLLTELVYGVTRNKIRLDNVIDQFLNQPSKKISLLLRSILRIGTYQILYLDRMPIRAAVNEATLQAKRLIGEGVSGLVNAVLRKISDNKNSLNNDPAEDVDELSNYYSHPKWLVSRWVHQYGMLTTKKILLHNNSRASLVLRTNTNKISFVKFVESLKSQDISLSREIPEFDSVEISNLGQSVSSIRGFEEGHFLVQDIASQVVPKLLRIQTRDLVLDACAAPGNKAFHLASALNSSLKLTVCDITERRLSETRKNLNRLGVTNFVSICGDSSDEFFARSLGMFDKILVDAPCSSLGVFRHNPEAKLNLNEKKLLEHSSKQRHLLKSLSTIVKPKGTLVYSVCSTSKEETLDVVRSFISENSGFLIDPIEEKGFKSFARVDDNGFLWTFPPSSDFPVDGFFAARFCRI